MNVSASQRDPPELMAFVRIRPPRADEQRRDRGDDARERAGAIPIRPDDRSARSLASSRSSGGIAAPASTIASGARRARPTASEAMAGAVGEPQQQVRAHQPERERPETAELEPQRLGRRSPGGTHRAGSRNPPITSMNQPSRVRRDGGALTSNPTIEIRDARRARTARRARRPMPPPVAEPVGQLDPRSGPGPDDDRERPPDTNSAHASPRRLEACSVRSFTRWSLRRGRIHRTGHRAPVRGGVHVQANGWNRPPRSRAEGPAQRPLAPWRRTGRNRPVTSRYLG